MSLQAYFHLMRFHKPMGIILLWMPTASALWIAGHGHPPWRLVVLFFLGTVCTRAAGCVINDMADYRFDRFVKRTAERPLVRGAVSWFESVSLFLGLLSCALLIVLQLPRACFYEALIAVLVMIIYPFCKRVLHAPQCVLGIAFSIGIPMAFSALAEPMNQTMLTLLIINLTWIIAYDTEYALVDRDDDLLIGVRSTAILLGAFDRRIIGLLQTVCHVMKVKKLIRHNLTYLVQLLPLSVLLV